GGGGASLPGCNNVGSWVSTGSVTNVEYFNAAWGADDADLWAVGKSTNEGSGIIAHWNGSSWSTEVVGSQGSVLNGIWGSASGTLYAVGSGGMVLKREAGGSWISFYSPDNVDLYGVWGTDANHFWVVGASGAAHYWSDTDWINRSIVGDANNTIGKLRSIWSYDGTVVWVSNETGAASANDYVLQRWEDEAWSKYASWSYYNQAVWGTAENDIWAVGYSKGTSAHFDGSQWTSSNAPAGSPNLKSVWGFEPGTVWAVGDGGQIDLWNGAEWTACTKVTQANLNAVTGTTSKAWAFGTGGIVLRNDL
ncbi:MAG TPA: hypothetical protein VJR89_17400, partial [Polyangiales bacterium]|nr:hypothetical protein [Polyangiales bacterium]